MISRETALNIAMNLIPDLQNRSYKITDHVSGNEISENLPPDCWYVIYSSVTINYSACSSGKNLYLSIDKQTGDIKT